MGPQQMPRLLNLAPRLYLQVGWGAGRLPSCGVLLLRPTRNPGLLTQLVAGVGIVAFRIHSDRTRGRVLVCVAGRGMDRRPRDIPFGSRRRGLLPGLSEGSDSSQLPDWTGEAQT